MKKVLAVIGVAILTVAIAVPASAQFKTWGSMQIASAYIENQDFNNGGKPSLRMNAQGKDRDMSYTQVWQRFNFFLQYGDPKTVRAVIGFEADSTDWGESTAVAAASKPGEGDFMGGSNTDKNMLGIKWAFIEFMVPNAPLQVTAGIQPFAYGGRLIEGQDSMGVSLAAMFAPHKITGMWYRRNEQAVGPGGYPASDFSGRLNYQVNDIYAIKYDLNQKAFDVQAYFAYQNDRFSGQVNPGSITATASILTPTAIADPFIDRPWWLGANVTFRPGNWTIYGQAVYKGGEREFDRASATRPQTRDYEAWAAELEVKYKIGPGMSGILEGFYSTGNDANSTDEFNQMSGIQGNEANSNFGLHRSLFFWMNFGEFANQHMKNLDQFGYWYGRAAFEYAPTPWLNLIANYLYIGDTSKGTPGPGRVVNTGFGARQDVDEDFVGHEINVIANVKIYEALLLNLGVAAFLPGDVFDLPVTATTGNASNTAWMGAMKLVYAF